MPQKLLAFALAALPALALAATAPSDGMAQQAFEKVMSDSDAGCISLAGFKINDRNVGRVFNNDVYIFNYEATIQSLSNCAIMNGVSTSKSVTGFTRASRTAGTDAAAIRIQMQPAQRIRFKGRITFTLHDDTWSVD